MGKKNPQLDALNFVALDFETGKYSPESAVSIGLVRFRGGEAVDSYYSLIRPPELYIRPDFTAIHGLRVEDVQNAPIFADLWERDILPFIGSDLLVAHNAPFDMGVLRALLAWYSLEKPETIPLKYFCSLKIARKTWRELRHHALTFLADTFGIVYDAHNALADAHTCGDIINRAAAKFGATTLRGLFECTAAGVQTL